MTAKAGTNAGKSRQHISRPSRNRNSNACASTACAELIARNYAALVGILKQSTITFSHDGGDANEKRRTGGALLQDR
jgi:hypothetical protein